MKFASLLALVVLVLCAILQAVAGEPMSDTATDKNGFKVVTDEKVTMVKVPPTNANTLRNAHFLRPKKLVVEKVVPTKN